MENSSPVSTVSHYYEKHISWILCDYLYCFVCLYYPQPPILGTSLIFKSCTAGLPSPASPLSTHWLSTPWTACWCSFWPGVWVLVSHSNKLWCINRSWPSVSLLSVTRLFTSFLSFMTLSTVLLDTWNMLTICFLVLPASSRSAMTSLRSLYQHKILSVCD